MQAPAIPANEQERLEALRSYEILDTAPEKDFDDLTRLASTLCQTPIAMLSLVDAQRQWFKSKVGTGVQETPRDVSFCGHAILQPNLFVVPDAQADARFADNPLVQKENVRFYAGAPLTTPQGQVLGTLCVIDHVARELTEEQKDSLWALARQAAVQLEMRMVLREIQKAVMESRGKRSQQEAVHMAAQLREFADELAAINSELRTEVVRRRAAQEALRASEEKHRLVLETATDAVVLLDETNTIRYANASVQQVFGYEPRELLGKSASLLMPERMRPIYAAALKSYLETGVRQMNWRNAEMTGLHKLGHEFPAEVTFNEVMLSEKHLFAFFIRDLTERKGLEAQLLQAQKLEVLGRMSGSVAHDFNNLITTLDGYCALAERHLNDPADARVHLQEARRVVERAAALTRQLLAFSRQQTITPRELDLNSVVKDMADMLRRMAGDLIEVQVTLAEEISHIQTDPTQLEQVLINLVVNARDAMTEGGKIVIETADCSLSSEGHFSHGQNLSAGRYTRLTVKDNGCGMAPETLTRIFEPFFTTKRPDKGTGLGLATVYGIVKQSMGAIHVESGQGKGTRFDIYFPAMEAAKTAKSPATAQTELKAAG